jgi:hypothetical protein
MSTPFPVVGAISATHVSVCTGRPHPGLAI